MDKLLKAIIDFPKQLKFKPFLIQRGEIKKWRPDGIIIFGMGGSALPGETVKGLSNEFNIPAPIVIWKNYGLPNHFFKNPLLIFTSFSGNTEETIDALVRTNPFGKLRVSPEPFGTELMAEVQSRRTKKYGSKVVITSGGKLEKMAKKSNVPMVLVPHDSLTPRQAVGYMVFAQLKILKEIFPKVKIPDIKFNARQFENEGRKLAEAIGDKIPLIYASKQNLFLANYWKVNFNETNGVPSFCNFLPEIDHNEIAGFARKNLNKNFFAVFLINKSDDAEIKNRALFTQKFFKDKGLESIILQEKNDRVKNAFSLFVLSDWTSYYLVKLRKINPSAGTQTIEQFKKMMK